MMRSRWGVRFGVVFGALSASADAATLYGVTATNLVRFDTTNPSIVTVIGAHGIPSGGGDTAFALAFHPGERALFGMTYIVTGQTYDQNFVRYDVKTGAATVVATLPTPGEVIYEALDYADALGTLVVSSATAGFLTNGLQSVSPDGVLAPLTENGRDNDYCVYDSSRDLFYTIDPNEVGQFVLTNLVSGATTNLGGTPTTLGDMAYVPDEDLIYAYDYTTNALFRVQTTNGGTPITITDIGLIGGDQLVGLAFVPGSCPGDVDGDGDVDFADLNALLEHFNDSGAGLPGDFDDDEDVDFNDLNTLLGVYNTACG